MRTSILLSLLFLVCLVAGLVAFAPLSFAMRSSGIAGQGIGWQQARGSVWSGQVTGLTWKRQPLGSVNIESSIARLVSGQPLHEARWNGPAGQGRALVTLQGQAVEVRDLSASFPVDRIGKLDPALAGLGSTVRLSKARLVMRGSRCLEAEGTVTTDLARLAATAFDRDWPVLTGPLSCEQGEPVARLTGTADDGTVLALSGRPSDGLRLELETPDPDVRAILQASGFQADGNKLVYSRSPAGMEESQP